MTRTGRRGRPSLVLTAVAAAVVGSVTTGSVLGTAVGRAAEARSAPGLAQAQLSGRAVLPARTFREAVPSGSLIQPANGVDPPFARQPVQGFSALLTRPDGTYNTLSDNGYGTEDNSADFLLRVRRVAVSYPRGTVKVVGGFGLSDPDRRIAFPLHRPDRRLTGADLDPESFRRVADGTYWFGEEFGPFLLHTDARGRVLEAPVPIPGVASPQDPLRRTPTVGASRGLEGMALSVDGRRLLPMLEGTVAGDPAGDLRLYSYDLRRKRFDRGPLKYRLEHPSAAIGDLTAVDEHRYLVIERDNEQGDAARLKAVYVLDTRDRDDDGYVDKDLLVNLLAVPDPAGIGRDGAFFRFPFQTIESVALLDDATLVIANDNNFPFSAGRTPGAPDGTEFITVRLGTPLGADRRALPPR